MKVRVIALAGMRGFDVCAALEVFGGDRRDRGVPLNDVAAVSPSPEPELEGGLRIRALPLEEADGADLLLIPGFADPLGAVHADVARGVPGGRDVHLPAASREDAARLGVAGPGDAESGVAGSDVVRADVGRADVGRADVGRAIALVLRLHGAGTRIASLCTGAFLLAATGLLDGADATTHWHFCDELQRRHKRVRVDPKALYTHDVERRLWTSAGVAAGIDACLAILAQERGSAAAAAVARSMVLPAVRPGGQAQFIPPLRGETEGKASEGEALRGAILRDLAAPWTAQTMADCAHASPRTLHRRFLAETGMPPIRWLISRRVAAAQELLETTALGVEQIASRVGFGGAVSMRKHFVASVGVPPIEYRRAFQRDGAASRCRRAFPTASLAQQRSERNSGTLVV